MAQLTNTILNGKLVVNGNIYGNLIGNAATATSATNAISLNGKAESALSVSYATTASTATNATTAANATSLNGKAESALSVSYATTASTATSATSATSATKIETGAASSTSTYVLLGVTSNTAAQTPVRTGIEIVGTNINASAYTLNVGTIKGNYEVEGAVEQATYAVSAGYAGYSLKLNNGAGDLNVGSSMRPVYFSAGIPYEINSDSAVDIISKSAVQISKTATASNTTYYVPFVSGSTTATASLYVGNSKAFTFNPSSGLVVATKFSGAFSGNATSATSAGYTTKVSAASSTSKNYIIGAVSIGSSQSILANANVYVTSGNTVVAPTFSGIMKATMTDIDSKTDYFCALPFIDCTDGGTPSGKPIDVISPEAISFTKSTSNNTVTLALSFATYDGVNSKVVAKEFVGNASSASYASRVVTTSKQTGSYHLTMVSASTTDTDGADIFVSNSKALTYNVSSGVLSATTFSGAFSGNATSATSATIAEMTFDTYNGNAEYSVPIITGSSLANTKKALAIAAKGITINPSTGVVTATTFSGAFSGNASSATYASRVVTTSKQTGSYHLTMVSASTSDTDGADLLVSNSKALTYNVSTGVLSATKFSGAFSGNATSASYASSLKVQNYQTSPGYLLAAVSATGTSLPIYSNTNIVYYPSISTLKTPNISTNAIIHSTSEDLVIGNSTNENYVKFVEDAEFSTSVAVEGTLEVTDDATFNSDVYMNSRVYINNSLPVLNNTDTGYGIHVLSSTEFAALQNKSTSVIYFITP